MQWVDYVSVVQMHESSRYSYKALTPSGTVRHPLPVWACPIDE